MTTLDPVLHAHVLQLWRKEARFRVWYSIGSGVLVFLMFSLFGCLATLGFGFTSGIGALATDTPVWLAVVGSVLFSFAGPVVLGLVFVLVAVRYVRHGRQGPALLLRGRVTDRGFRRRGKRHHWQVGMELEARCEVHLDGRPATWVPTSGTEERWWAPSAATAVEVGAPCVAFVLQDGECWYGRREAG